VTTLEQIRDLEAGAAYPGYLLEGCRTALVFFCAAFLGKQDCAWIAEAGLTGTCVDRDGDRLDEMAGLYPDGWEFLKVDVYEFAEETGGMWDIVSLDPWTQDFDRCAEALPLWCSLARRAVVLGTGVDTKVEAPDGWAVTEVRKRTDYDGGVFWTIVERA
jgi:hypothetical protein